MPGALPAEVTVTESQGVHYRFPPRELGAYRIVGLALLVPGLFLGAVPSFAAWKIASALWQGAGDQALLWLGGFMIGIGCFALGWRLGGIGLLIFAGGSEIEMKGGVLY